MDRARVERIIEALIVELGEDPMRSGLRGTPARAAEMIAMFALPKAGELTAPSSSESDGMSDMRIIENVRFLSICEHHLLPFYGRIEIGCITRARPCDADLCARVVERCAHRPQLQERLTEQIADALVKLLEPHGIGVAADGRHMCMMMRGVEKQSSAIRSSTLRGAFLEPATRAAFFAHVHRARRR